MQKDLRILLVFFIGGILILIARITTAESEQEQINKIINKYNEIRKEYYKTDLEKLEKQKEEIEKINKEISFKQKCIDYNYAHYNSVVEPINCDNEFNINKEIIENWKVNKDGQAQVFNPLFEKTKEERINQLLLSYGRGEDVIEKRWQRVANKYGIKTEVLVCIAKADSSLGQALKSKNNFGNVGNNDRGDVVHFSSPIQGIEAIAQTLNNQYLFNYNKISELSRWGNKNGKIYASSEENWHNNVINCISNIYGEPVKDDFIFRD